MDAESGGHRVQRVASTDKRGRVHSSTVTVAVLEGHTALPATTQARPDSEFRIVWFSGTGAGGQHRNKHQNSARITHLPTGLVRTAQTRSRENSKAEAMSALNAELDRVAFERARGGLNSIRRDQVGSGERSDRRRVWAFQRDVVEDLVTGRSARCRDALNGGMDRLWR